MKPLHRTPNPCWAGNEAMGVGCEAVADQSIVPVCTRELTGSPAPIVTEVPVDRELA